MADSFNLNQIWRLFSKDRDARIILNSYNQSSSFNVFMDKTSNGSKRPVVNVYLDMTANKKMVNLLKKLITSTPNTRLSFVQLRWDSEKKANNVTASLVFGKAEDGTYYLEASSPQQQTPVVFPFTPITNVEVEGKTNTPAENSEYAVGSLIRALDTYLPVAELLSTWNYQPGNKQQQQRGGGNSGGYNASSGGGDSIF